MNRTIKNFLIFLFLIMLFSSCKSSNISIENLMYKKFYARDNGRIYLDLFEGVTPSIHIKLPDYCWNKQSGIIVNSEGKLFKKVDKSLAKIDNFNPKIEMKNGKYYLNCNSEFFDNFRFQVIDEFTILDTLLDIKYVDTLGKYNIEDDNNEYPNEYRELKELVSEYSTTIEDYKKYKDQLPVSVRKEIEKKIELEKNKN